MTSFLTLTPNPALDIATSTEQVLPTHKLRCGTVQRYPGGGGINVARVLHRLGADVEARALVGGPAGAQLQALLQQEGVACQMHPIAGDTRENMSVLETRTGQEFRFVLPGPTVDHTQWQALLEALLPTQSRVRNPPGGSSPAAACRPECRTTFMRNWPRSPTARAPPCARHLGRRAGGSAGSGSGARQAQPARVARLAATAAEHRAGMR
jgi:6-phosphofructokinase 2